MPIYLPSNLEDLLKRLASTQGTSVQSLVVEALQSYLESISATDISPEEIAQTQITLLGELADIEPWDGSDAPR
jgi:hypothetical protein